MAAQDVISARIGAELRERLDAVAERLKMSRSALLTRVAAFGLNKLEDDLEAGNASAVLAATLKPRGKPSKKQAKKDKGASPGAS